MSINELNEQVFFSVQRERREMSAGGSLDSRTVFDLAIRVVTLLLSTYLSISYVLCDDR